MRQMARNQTRDFSPPMDADTHPVDPDTVKPGHEIPVDSPTEAAPRAADEAVEIIKTVVYALLIAVVLRVLLFQPFTIPSGSMIPNLQIGDYIVVSKFSYGYSRHSIPFSPPIFKGRIFNQVPHRGDIVVFKDTKDNRTDYVKRLIGLPGDRIQVMGGSVYINGKVLAQTLLPQTATDRLEGATRATETFNDVPGGRPHIVQDLGTTPFDDTEIFYVPQHTYFMMGDNRDNSADSRVPKAEGGIEYVPEENLVGRARVILFSWNEGASLFKPWTWITKARPSRFFNVLK
jgi:signal peptidase I